MLCIIEAELWMNEIKCPYDGEIVAIKVADAQSVKYGECLFAMNVKRGVRFDRQHAEQFVAGERGIACFSTGFVRRGLRATARAT